MKNRAIVVTALTVFTGVLHAQDSVVSKLQAEYRSQGASGFSAAAGESMWHNSFPNGKSGQQGSCRKCHTADLRHAGKHVVTGKPIKPMAPSINPERLTDRAKVEKWFLRNCKWTLGRQCTAQEKGDLLEFIAGQ
jgi:hypothetical protein